MGKTKSVGKNRESNYHPPTSGEEELANDVTIRHPNRNVNKRNDALRENTFKGKQQSAESDKSKNETFAEPLTDTVAEELPEILSKDLLAQLKAFSSECCISIYLPTHQAGMEVNEGQDAIRFKNLLQQTTAQLTDKGYDEGTVKKWLKPVYDLYQEDAFWKQQAKGLALFISDHYCRYLRMRQAPEEKVYINKSFALAPLAGLLINPEYFYLLVISKRQAKLFRADDYGMAFVPIENMPGSEPESQANKERSIPDESFYGISGSKTNTAQYCKAISDTLKEAVLKNEHVPLLLAGVDSVVAAYRAASDYPHIWETALTGSHEQEDIATLYPQVRTLLQPYFEQRLHKALELYGNQSATPLTSTNPAVIIPAAHYGRVSHLFVAKQEQLWGSFDEQNNELTIQAESTGNNEDLYDKAITQTLLTGGEVFELDPEKMPASVSMAAILRYQDS